MDLEHRPTHPPNFTAELTLTADAGRIEAGRIEAGRIEAGRIEAGRIKAGRIEAGRIATQPLKRLGLPRSNPINV